MRKKRLSKSEEQLLQIFWQKNQPLTSVELFELSQATDETSSWSINYIHKMLAALLEQDLLELCGFVKEGKRYIRQFVPRLSKEEYLADILDQQGINTTSLAKIAVALVKKQDEKGGEITQNQLIAELEKMIDEFERLEDKSN